MLQLAIAYKNFAAYKGISHIGLGVAALNNSKVLAANGASVAVWPVTNNIDIVRQIIASKPDHLVIQAPWLSTRDVSAMVHAFPETQFAVVSHSNIGFLQADPNGIRLLREYGELVHGTHNFHLAGNSLRFVESWEHMFRVPMLYLPNLYYVDEVEKPAHRWNGGVLRIGIFGAVRPLKNFLTAAAAAISIGRWMQADLELWFSGGRTEGGGDVMWRAVNQLCSGVHRVKLVQVPWESWPKFRDTVASMHLLLQPSYTESFNMVTADGIVQGVPSVVSGAIDWVPRSWTAHFDHAMDIADVGVRLLRSPLAIWRGRRALARHNRAGINAWKYFLEL